MDELAAPPILQREHDRAQHYTAVQRVLVAVLFANLLVTAIKITLGLLTGVLAVVADGFHSLVDSSSNLVGLAAINLARRPADEQHPYGYRRYETVGALAIGGLLLAAAWEIGGAVVERVFNGAQPGVTLWLVGLLAFTLPVNLLIVMLETRAGKRLNSEILLADATHTRTDLWITGSVLVSLVGVWMGWGWLDLAVASGVVVMILRAAFGILRDSAGWLTDTVAADADQIEAVARSVAGVWYVHRIRSRGTPGAAYVDLHVKVHPGMSTIQAHAIASEVERRLTTELPNVADALAHIEPAPQPGANDWQRMAYDLRQIADGIGLGLHDLHIHADHQGDYAIELHLEIDGDTMLAQAHALAETFEQRVRQRLPHATSIITHLEPLPEVMLHPDDRTNPQLVSQVERALAGLVGDDNVLEVQCHIVRGQLSVAVRLQLSADLSLAAAHTRAEAIEHELLAHFPALARVVVHAEPHNRATPQQ